MDRHFFILFNDFINELGSSLSNKIIIILLFSFIPTIILTNEESSNDIDSQFSYYRYWNPYKRILDFKGDKASFIGDTFYKVSFNKEKRTTTDMTHQTQRHQNLIKIARIHHLERTNRYSYRAYDYHHLVLLFHHVSWLPCPHESDVHQA